MNLARMGSSFDRSMPRQARLARALATQRPMTRMASAARIFTPKVVSIYCPVLMSSLISTVMTPDGSSLRRIPGWNAYQAQARTILSAKQMLGPEALKTPPAAYAIPVTHPHGACHTVRRVLARATSAPGGEGLISCLTPSARAA